MMVVRFNFTDGNKVDVVFSLDLPMQTLADPGSGVESVEILSVNHK